MADLVHFDITRHPPGGWTFNERIKGKAFAVKDPFLPFLDCASEILAWRRNNGIPSKLSACVAALRRHTMVRLGINPNREAVIDQQVVAAESGRGCCGRKRR